MDARRRAAHLRVVKVLLQRLFDHLFWADQLALAAVREGGERSGTSRALLAHVLGAEHVWLSRLEDRPSIVGVWPELTVDECARLAADLRVAFQSFLDAQDERSLARSVHYRNSAGAEFDSRVDDILTHVALHGAYHRGQVALALRQEGARPNPTDYIAFIRGAPTATREDAARFAGPRGERHS